MIGEWTIARARPGACLAAGVTRWVCAFLAVWVLGACGSSGGLPDYAKIRPVYRAMNTPRPVPTPRVKPDPEAARRVARAAATPAPRRPAQLVKASASRSPGEYPTPKPRQAPNVVTVQRGDTVYSLAQAHKLAVQDVIRRNRLAPPYTVHPGDRLALPPARHHTVAKGETGYAIARRYGVTWAAVVRVNDLSPPYDLRVGQTLRLPSGSTTPGGNQGQGARKAVVRRDADRPLPDPPARSGSGFAWPVQGTIIAGYGRKDGGLQNDGINIAAPAGTPVRATETGTVVYAGDRLAGYGKLLLIRHADGWVSAYAHNQRLLVAKGDQVRRRQIIAHVGQTGTVDRPQLHFELRHHNRPVDPKGRLNRITASR